MNKTAAGAILWSGGVLGYLLLEAIAATGYRPSYSYVHDYISDLGVRGTRTPLMHAAFYLQGSMFLAGAALIAGVRGTRARLFVALVAANAVGNFVVGTAHTGKVHVAGAALALVGGNAAILAGAAVVGPIRRWYRSVSNIIAAVGFLCLSLLVTGIVMPTGVAERGSAYSIFLWQLLTAWLLWRRGRSTVTSR
ncbi:hypothetical protein A5634_06720 [Mycobacterium asiaticum]|uniref:DUF998 domain-containing protein n=1 Tax=Mycobacterium asiaticum TaxID=1790 RepID=A0A1A3NRA9_MYCAS|nr:DUF998 domain-containing protein [Mycobacterium asiaticum]OBK22867.1 hypothetical protein A5634_06720 [Mycobacterium asiaticum]